MANNWDKLTKEDYEIVRQNKVNYHNTDNQAYRDIYRMNNDKVRARYGISPNEDISLGELDSYIAATDKKRQRDEHSNALLTNLTDYAQNTDQRVEASADRLRNFSYNPSADPSFGAYADMYNRQGQSAAKQTINNLNSANMGRNSSYGAAAAAQVQQAYAQKASEMIPALEQQAYQRLVNQYNMENQLANDRFARNMDVYNLIYNANAMDADLAHSKAVTEGQLIDNRYAPQVYADAHSQSVAQTEGDVIDNLNKQTVYDDQHNKNLGLMEAQGIENNMNRLRLDALPQQIQQEIEMGALELAQKTYENENLSYEVRINKIAAEIQEKYGLSTAEAQLLAQKADTAYTRSRTY